jgi:hypothetical protein
LSGDEKAPNNFGAFFVLYSSIADGVELLRHTIWLDWRGDLGFRGLTGEKGGFLWDGQGAGDGKITAKAKYRGFPLRRHSAQDHSTTLRVEMTCLGLGWVSGGRGLDIPCSSGGHGYLVFVVGRGERFADSRECPHLRIEIWGTRTRLRGLTGFWGEEIDKNNGKCNEQRQRRNTWVSPLRQSAPPAVEMT